VLFRIQHMQISYTYGRFNEPTGTFILDASDPGMSRVEMQILAANIDTANAKRDGHLKSPDFFNAKVFPAITFKSTAVKKTSDTSYEITGDMTLHGVSKSVTLTMTQTGEGKTPMNDYRVGFEGTLSLKRSDYGMDKMIPAAADEVKLTLSVEAVKQ
jgi:polyisoprenoid-binding protein YceI